MLALHHVRGWTFSYIHRGTVMRGTIELMQDNLGKVTMSHQVECDINTYIIDIIITLDLHWYQVTRTYDIHGSVSDKVNGFCKCLIFPKSGFSRFSNFLAAKIEQRLQQVTGGAAVGQGRRVRNSKMKARGYWDSRGHISNAWQMGWVGLGVDNGRRRGSTGRGEVLM